MRVCATGSESSSASGTMRHYANARHPPSIGDAPCIVSADWLNVCVGLSEMLELTA